MTVTKVSKARRAALMLAAAVAVTGAVQIAAAGPASAACTYSKFRVVWSQAGVYSQADGRLLEVRSYGNTVYGPGGGINGFTNVYTTLGNPALMHAASIDYIGCF